MAASRARVVASRGSGSGSAAKGGHLRERGGGGSRAWGDLHNMPIEVRSVDRVTSRVPHMRGMPRSRAGAANDTFCMTWVAGGLLVPARAPAQELRANDRLESGRVTAAITAIEPAIRPRISPPVQCSSL